LILLKTILNIVCLTLVKPQIKSYYESLYKAKENFFDFGRQLRKIEIRALLR
jgi:hypothetical protein